MDAPLLAQGLGLGEPFGTVVPGDLSNQIAGGNPAALGSGDFDDASGPTSSKL